MQYYFKNIFLSLLLSIFFVRDALARAPVYAALVADARTGKILYNYNADALTQPASLTKMMTLLLTFDALRKRKIRKNTLIRFSANAAAQSPSVLGAKRGDYITVDQAILALITKSANDVAVALAEHLSNGSETRFVAKMNRKARELKMYSTFFTNPSGWKDSNQKTTARDMMKLSQVLINNYNDFYHLFSIKNFYYKGTMCRNHNNLLKYKNSFVVDGIKTGFVNASGFNLAASARKGRRRLIAIVLGGLSAKWRDNRVKLLFTKAFQNKGRFRLDSNDISPYMTQAKNAKIIKNANFHIK